MTNKITFVNLKLLLFGNNEVGMKNKEGFIKQFAIIGSGTLINLILGLISTPIITRILAPEEYGQLSIFTMYANIAVMVLSLGLDQATVRYYYEDDSIKYKQGLVFRCIWLPILVSILLSGLVIGLSCAGIINFEFNTIIIVFLCVHVVSQIIYRFSQLVVRLERKVKLYSSLQIIQKIIYIVLAIGLCLVVKGNFLILLVAATVFSFGTCMVISIVIQKDIWNLKFLERKLCNISMKELLKYSAPFILSMGVTTLFQAIDKISLNHFCSYAEVGIYSSTMTIVHIFAIVQTAFNTLWAPMAIEHYTKYPQDTKFHQRANQIITVVMFFLGISLILVKDVFAILLGEKYREAAYILPFLIFNPIMFTISETTVGGLVFKKKSNLQVVVALGACVTNIIGNTLLVPRIGSQGAAISTGVSYIVFYLLRTILGMKYYYVDFKLSKFLVLTTLVSAYALYNTFIKFNIGSIIGYIVCFVVLIILYKDVIFWCFNYCFNMIIKRKKKIS